MNSRERVLTALDHHEPDRVPIDLGGSAVSSIAIPTYAALRDHLGLPKRPIQTLETVQQVAVVDDDVLDIFGVDVIPVFSFPPAGYAPVFVDEGPRGESFQDEFGATLRRPRGGFYYDWQEFPLAEPSIEAMEKMPWPDPADPARYRGLRQSVQSSAPGPTGAVRHRPLRPRPLQPVAPRPRHGGGADGHGRRAGVRRGLLRPFDRHDHHRPAALPRRGGRPDRHPLRGRRLDRPGGAADLAGAVPADDQAALGADPRSDPRADQGEDLLPRLRRRRPFLPDLIEIGVEILNPVQVSAKDMDTASLKKEFGGKLSFWGGGCDTQRVLNLGGPEEVRAGGSPPHPRPGPRRRIHLQPRAQHPGPHRPGQRRGLLRRGPSLRQVSDRRGPAVAPLACIAICNMMEVEEDQAMGAFGSTSKTDSTLSASPLMVRLDEESRRSLVEAADLRHISVSDYVRTVDHSPGEA